MYDFKSDQYKQWNNSIIQEFRTNGGKMGGPFTGVNVLLLTTRGRKTGREFTTPLVYARDGERIVIFGSKGGHDEHPHWYNNLVAHPEVTVELGTEKFQARAQIITGDERDRLFERQAAAMPNFAEYQAKTSRTIPVVALERQ